MKTELSLKKAYRNNNIEFIKNTLNETENEKRKLDKWFNRYLDLLNDRIDENEFNNPVHSLYMEKYINYSKLCRIESLAKFYLGKF